MMVSSPRSDSPRNRIQHVDSDRARRVREGHELHRRSSTMNQLDLKGRVAIITGGARGIGYAVAERILRSGGTVALWDRDKDRLEEAHDDLSAFGTVACAALELTAHSD